MDFPLNLNLEFAKTRIYRVTQAIDNWLQRGYKVNSEENKLLKRAIAKLERARQASETRQMAGWVNESLQDSLWAGEKAVFRQAQWQIERNGPRPQFLFGCSSWGHPLSEENYNLAFKNLFNFSTLPLYWKNFEPAKGKFKYANLDRYIAWLQEFGLTPKGHPLVWFHEAGIPNWLTGKSYSQVLQLTRERVFETTRYFGARIPYYDVINEAHDISWTNVFDYSPEQLLDLTMIAAQESIRGYQNIQRIVNCCCVWAEYVPIRSKRRKLKSAYQYLKECITSDIPFEIIGLQLYYPNQDMFEINRLLERFSLLGKEIHITELGVSSSAQRDETSYLKDPSGLWHDLWSESVQADWIEHFYTICYSKPYITAISWWDLPDGGFWPHGGLLRRDMTPKKSYMRLQNLRYQWSQ